MASLPRSERSIANTYERLVLSQSRQTALDLALELVQHHVAWHPGGEGGAYDGGLLGAVQALEQGEQAGEIHREAIGSHGGTLWAIMPLADTFQEIVDSLPSDW